MKEEIKEILENVKKCCDITIEQNFTVYQRQDILKLLDYITNLQQENEFLKLNNPEMNIEHFRIVKENKRKIDNLRKENEDYKSRCEKAVEFTKKESKKCYSNQITDDPQKVIGNFMWHTDKLLNILNGGDKE